MSYAGDKRGSAAWADASAPRCAAAARVRWLRIRRRAALRGVRARCAAGIRSSFTVRLRRPGDRDRAGSLPRLGCLRLRGTDPKGAGAPQVRGRQSAGWPAFAGRGSDIEDPPGDDGSRAVGPGPGASGAKAGARLQPGRAHRTSARGSGRATRGRPPRARAPDHEAAPAGSGSTSRQPPGGVRCAPRDEAAAGGDRGGRHHDHDGDARGVRIGPPARLGCTTSTDSRSRGRSRERRPCAARLRAECRSGRLPRPPARDSLSLEAPTRRRATA